MAIIKILKSASQHVKAPKPVKALTGAAIKAGNHPATSAISNTAQISGIPVGTAAWIHHRKKANKGSH